FVSSMQCISATYLLMPSQLAYVIFPAPSYPPHLSVLPHQPSYTLPSGSKINALFANFFPLSREGLFDALDLTTVYSKGVCRWRFRRSACVYLCVCSCACVCWCVWACVCLCVCACVGL